MHRPGIKKRFPPFYADELSLSLCLVYTNIHLLITRKENQQEREPAFKGLSLYSFVSFASTFSHGGLLHTNDRSLGKRCK